MNDQLTNFLTQKRKEYEHAEKHGLKMLMQVIRESVKKTVKNHQVKLLPGQQQTLF